MDELKTEISACRICAEAPKVFASPHPSWRNTSWLKRNPWFDAEVLPALRVQVHEALNG